jgi:dephospho-CoA kinase
MPPKIIGISGTNGSGKDTVGRILEENHDYLFISVTDILRKELKIRGLSLQRENMRILSSEWRKQYGLGVLVDKAKEIFVNTEGKYSGLAIASLRNPGEADSVHAYGGVVLWVDSDPRVRYERIISNHRGEDRAVDDDKTFEEFMADEDIEMHYPPDGDETTLSLLGVKEKCDFYLYNEGSNLLGLDSAICELLGFRT